MDAVGRRDTRRAIRASPAHPSIYVSRLWPYWRVFSGRASMLTLHPGVHTRNPLAANGRHWTPMDAVILVEQSAHLQHIPAFTWVIFDHIGGYLATVQACWSCAQVRRWHTRNVGRQSLEYEPNLVDPKRYFIFTLPGPHTH